MITVDHVSRRYGEFTAVNNVAFTIGHGEIVGLLGHNGAGKTTIMKMLTGYLEPSEGRIRIDQFDIENQSKAAQRLIGYLPENLPVYAEMSVVDYLYFAAKMRGVAAADVDDAVRLAISRTDLASKAFNPISTLSRGYKQRVGVAQAIIHQPKLLILDEPTNGLDPQQTQQMRELIRTLSAHATVILSTHIMQEVDALCDRVLILRNGQLVVDEQLATLRNSNTLLLTTDASETALNQLIKALPFDRVLVNEQGEGQSSYTLHAHGNAALDECAAALAEQLISAGHRLYGLTPHQRDLESLFRDVNRAKEVGHAA